MNRLIIGALAGIAAGYCIRKMHDENKFDPIIDRANEFASKAKKTFRNVVDKAQNEAEYLKDRAEDMMGVEKPKHATVKNGKGSKK